MEFSNLVIFTPFLRTSAGNRLLTAATLFCTLTAATSGSVPTSKITSETPIPSFPASEVMYFMPGTPLMAFSMGIIAALATVSALAPGYSIVTSTIGGAILGNKVIGRRTRAKIPKKTMIKDITMERTGLCMNFDVITF